MTQADPEMPSALDMTRENVTRLLEEKAGALAAVRRLADRLRKDGNRMGLAPWFYADLLKTFDMFVLYIEGFGQCARACVLTQYFLATKSESARRDAGAAVTALAAFAGELRASVSRTALLHYVYMLLDPDRVDALVRDLQARLT